MINPSSFESASFLREDFRLRFHNIIGFSFTAILKMKGNPMILRMDSRERFFDLCIEVELSST